MIKASRNQRVMVWELQLLFSGGVFRGLLTNEQRRGFSLALEW